MHSTAAILRKAASSHSVRTALSLFFVLNTVLLMCFVQGFAYFTKNGFYDDGGEALHESIVDSCMKESSRKALQYFRDKLLYSQRDSEETPYLSGYEEMFSEANSNFFFTFSEKDRVIFSSGPKDQPVGRSYCPDSETFFSSDEKIALICNTSALTFKGFLVEELTANDVYMKVYRFFRYAGVFKYLIIALLIFSCLAEVWITVLLYRLAGVREGTETLFQGELDRIPLYLLLLFYIPIIVAGAFWLRSKAALLNNWVQYLDGTKTGTALRTDLYTFLLITAVLAVLLKTLISTLSVRFKMPLWWQQSVLFRSAAFRGIEQRLRSVLMVLALAEFAMIVLATVLSRQAGTNGYIYLLIDLFFTVVLVLFINIVERNVHIWLRGTRRIVRNKRGYVPTDALGTQFRRHAENINFLSRSASAETEKRFINESFSTRLINSVSSSLRGPLSAVTENVAKLQQGTLSESEEKRCIGQINSLSQELKKTIEDLIRISKATTGNLEVQAVPTDIGMMLMQTAGEYAELFAEKGIELVTKYAQEPITISADGQCMWYIFDGVLTVLRNTATPGTRIFLDADAVKGRAVIRFRGSVRSTALEQGNLIADNSLGLPTAKVFTELQGGTMHTRCRQDTLTVVLQFPQQA